MRALGDLLPPHPRLLIVGINPGTRSAAVGRHFAGPGNRFWPALHAAGVTPRPLRPDEQTELLGLGIGITNLVPRTTARAAELSDDELRAGGADLLRRVGELAPAVVAVLGVGAYRRAFDDPRAGVGRQPQRWAGASWWVLHNPSGLNAHAQLADHAAALRAVAVDAGLTLSDPHTTGSRSTGRK